MHSLEDIIRWIEAWESQSDRHISIQATRNMLTDIKAALAEHIEQGAMRA